MKPEIIKKLAEKAMGYGDLWTIRKHGLYYRPDAHGYTGRLDEAWKVPLEIAKQHEYLCGYDQVTIHRVADIKDWNPWTSDADALGLLGKCAEHLTNGIVGIGSPMGERVASNVGRSQGWVVGVIGKPSNFECEAPTLREAICNFAIKLFNIT